METVGTIYRLTLDGGEYSGGIRYYKTLQIAKAQGEKYLKKHRNIGSFFRYEYKYYEIHEVQLTNGKTKLVYSSD